MSTMSMQEDEKDTARLAALEDTCISEHVCESWDCDCKEIVHEKPEERVELGRPRRYFRYLKGTLGTEGTQDVVRLEEKPGPLGQPVLEDVEVTLADELAPFDANWREAKRKWREEVMGNVEHVTVTKRRRLRTIEMFEKRGQYAEISRTKCPIKEVKETETRGELGCWDPDVTGLYSRYWLRTLGRFEVDECEGDTEAPSYKPKLEDFIALQRLVD